MEYRMENPAATITKAASKQTYYTIRFLADRGLVDDAYRTYAYFRWVDDILDAASESGPVRDETERSERREFLDRQKVLLEVGYRNDIPSKVSVQERMLVDLIRSDPDRNSGLGSYLRNMMRVMDFDVRRRGRLIAQAELDEYTRWLAVAVTDAMQYFIGHGEFAPRDGTRYLAVSAAHITHMLRDTYNDARDGYFNIPREVLETHHIGPQDVRHEAYRAWVQQRVRLAREYFIAGGEYFRRSQNRRHRLAGFAYMSRFEWLLDTIAREGYVLRPRYNERRSPTTGVQMILRTLSAMLAFHSTESPSRRILTQR
jgi:phytoene/squalene synthetase